MHVTINGTSRELTDTGTNVGKLLREAGYMAETVAVIINGEVVTEDETIRTGDDITILKAISGG